MGARKPQQPRLAKLSQPRLHNAVKRERLFALLDARKQQPIIWVGAPAGAGKTTLVASYLEARRARTLWYQVDEGDKDPATFFHYLSELARNGKKRALPRLSVEDLGAFARYYFREFFRQIGSNAVLVLDNCQDAAGEAFHLILCVACEELPQQCSIIALSRSVLPSELARLAAHGAIQQIVWRDLRLTADEAQALGKAKGENDHAKLESAYRLSDGWATGLMLTLTHTRTAVNEPTARLDTREALFNYLLSEMLSRVSAEARKVLTHAALFPQVTVPLAESISGIVNAGKVLDELYRNQYLVDRKVDAELTYQFHDLFRDFLLDALAKDLPAKELAELRIRAARMLETAGQVNEAVQLFRQAQDWDSVVRAIKQHALTLFYQGRWQTIGDWYEGMPEAMAAGDTWLVYWRGRVLTATDTPRARALLELAFERSCAANDDVGVLAAAMPLWETVMLLGEPWTAYRAWLPALERTLERCKRLPDTWLEIEGWEAYLLMSLFARGEGALLEEARLVMERTLRATERSGNERLAVANDASILAWVSADVGLSEYATSVISRFVRDEDGAIRRDDRSALLRHWGYYWLGLPSWCMGRSDQAIEAFENAMQLATQFRFAAADLSAYCYLSMSYHHAGMPEKAAAVLRDAQLQFDPRRSFHWGMYHLALAFDAYQRDDLEQAIAHQKVCIESLRTAGGLSMLAVAWPSEAAYYAQTGRLDEAVEVVEATKQATAKTIYRLSDAAHCFVLAEVALRRNDRPQAIEHLREGLQHARNPIKAGMLFSMTRSLPRLLSLAIEEELDSEAVHTLIERWRVTPGAAVLDRWPWPVKIYALGEFRVLVRDAPLPSKGKAHFKVLALLKAIVAGGARQVSSQTLAEWLWPDADGDMAAANLKVSLHRLRKLLGREDAVLLHDGKFALNDRVCWLDVWGFDAGFSDTSHEYSSVNKNGSDSTGHTIDLYKGHLLPQDDFVWLLAPRERLRAKFQRMALAAGKRHEAAQDFDAAARLYEGCLAIDASAEALHRHLMLCLKHAGRATEALDAFQRCERALAGKPSKETRQVYESLLRL
jgi:LuxR family transcriptional regulator, maltose regulon positive regulatory protein